MDRTISLTDKWYYYDGLKIPFGTGLFAKKAEFPLQKTSSFTLRKKIICPKQVNDTVTVFFSGNFNGLTVFASGKEVPSSVNCDGITVYDITSALKTGKTTVTATFDEGNVNGFFLSVKRKYE